MAFDDTSPIETSGNACPHHLVAGTRYPANGIRTPAHASTRTRATSQRPEHAIFAGSSSRRVAATAVSSPPQHSRPMFGALGPAGRPTCPARRTTAAARSHDDIAPRWIAEDACRPQSAPRRPGQLCAAVGVQVIPAVFSASRLPAQRG